MKHVRARHAEYEIVERIRDARVGVQSFVPNLTLLDNSYDQYYRGKHLLVVRGIGDYYRDYAIR